MKMYEIFNNYGDACYVVALVMRRDSNGRPDDVEIQKYCRLYEEAVMERDVLESLGKDIIICPPFKGRDVAPLETADYFRSFLGTNQKSVVPRLQWYVNMGC